DRGRGRSAGRTASWLTRAGSAASTANRVLMSVLSESRPDGHRATVEVSARWEAALLSYDRELRTARMSAHTIRAYGLDLRELAAWATEYGIDDPVTVGYPALRGYAAQLGERGLGRRTVARKLAAAR